VVLFAQAKTTRPGARSCVLPVGAAPSAHAPLTSTSGAPAEDWGNESAAEPGGSDGVVEVLGVCLDGPPVLAHMRVFAGGGE
jgi:hypothetical protein